MQKNDKVKIIILAAGKGKRMESELPKVLARVGGKTMIRHLIESIKNVTNEKPVAIVGYKMEIIKKELGDSCLYVEQKEQLGTGHAVSCAEKDCGDTEHIVVLYGDQPFISSETIKNLIDRHLRSDAIITLATTKVSDFEDWRNGFKAFGRILRKDGNVIGIREYKDANEIEKNIKEVNAGSYVFDAKWLWKNIKKIKNENAQKEYYLTDLIKIATEEKVRIKSIDIDAREALGANSKEELDTLEKFIQH